LGITEKTDATALVVSEESGNISYLKNGEFVPFDSHEQLQEIIEEDLS
jgi:DNA integrity scanning protein DisA with diadenylate cyclase activity